MNVPLFVMSDRITEEMMAEIERYAGQGLSYDSIELILYKVLSYVQMRKSQGYANAYIGLLSENKEEKKDEQSVQ